MIKVAYKVTNNGMGPVIEKTTVDDPQGLSWRDAKKQLRQFFLDKAAELRELNEKTYFLE